MSALFEPLKIRLVLSNLLIPSMPSHLDDILAAGAVNAVMASTNIEIKDYSEIIDHLPLDKYAVDDDWVYKASVLKFEKMQGKFMRPVSRRINKSLFASRRAEGTLNARGNKLNFASGPLKSAIGLLPTAAYVEVIAFCVGDKKRIAELFTHLTHIGKKHNRGQGEILSLEITRDVAANDCWRTRFLPLSMGAVSLENHVPAADIGTRPPYWKNQHPMALGLTNF